MVEPVRGATTARVVVIGGYDPGAVASVVCGLPARPGFTVIALAADGAVVDALRPVSALPVIELVGPTELRRDTVIAVPRGVIARVASGMLVVDAAHTAHAAPNAAPSAAINALGGLLQSCADELGADAVSIVLGRPVLEATPGLARLKRAGGLTIADRTWSGAPVIDLVLPLESISERLLDYARGLDEVAQLEEPPGAGGDLLQDVLTQVRIGSGLDFRDYRRPTMLRRIARRMQVRGAATMAAYLPMLASEPTEVRALVDDMLIGVTGWFRDPAAFEALATTVIPRAFAGKTRHDQVRVWVAGTATGEEAYSLGILLLEHASTLAEPPSIQVFASDLDDRALTASRRGRWPLSIGDAVSAPRLAQFFTRDTTGYQVSKALREIVMFSRHDVLRDPPFSQLDLVTCRNLLIYLGREAQSRVLAAFHFALRPDGFLFLGSSESVDSPARFSVLDPTHRLFARRGGRGAPALAELRASRSSFGPLPPRLTRGTPAPGSNVGDTHQRLVEAHAPPSVLVDDELAIVHISERAGRFMQPAGGEPTRQLLRLIHPGLRRELRASVFAARAAGRDARLVTYQHDDHRRAVLLRTHAVEAPEVGRVPVLVMFDEQPAVAEAEAETAPLAPVVDQLEEELLATREQLRTTIEQYEVSLEELEASNEELHAINEELRSTSEELETSREEFQAINVELSALNRELEVRVSEVSRANADLQNLMVSTQFGVVFLDRDLAIKRFTPAIEELINVRASDIGRPLAHFTHQLETSELPELAAKVLADLRPIELEVSSRDGRRFLVRLLPYRSLEDRIEGVVLTIVDVSELREAIDARQRTERALHDQEERLQVALGAAPMFVLTFDDRDAVTWGCVLGRELAPGDTASLSLFAPDDAAGLVARVGEVRRTGVGQRVELRILVDEAAQTYDVRIDPLREGTSAVGFDITPSKRAEAVLRETDRRKDEFLATLSHELRNPLTPLQMALEIAPLVDDDPVERRANLAVMDRQISQLATLVDELLDLSRITQGKVRLHLAPADPMALLEAAVEATAPLRDERRQVLHVRARAGGARVLGDRARLIQVLTNLLSNAAKYTPEGGRVDVDVEADPAGERVSFRVRDNGTGISAELLPRIFEIFVQSRDAEGRATGGLGIGLNLVQRLVALHNGAVTAISEGPGRGSTFVVELPQARE